MASKKVSKKVSAKGKVSKAPSRKAPPSAKRATSKAKAGAKKASGQASAGKASPGKASAKKATSGKPSAKTAAKVTAKPGAKSPKRSAKGAAKPAKKATSKKAPTKKATARPIAKSPAKKAAKAAKASVKKILQKAAKVAKVSVEGPVKSAQASVEKTLKKAVKSAKERIKNAPILAELAHAMAPAEDAPSGIDVGAPAPSFSLSDQDGARVSSSDFAGKPYVLYFYPKDDTPGCTKEACDFRDEHQAFRAAGIAVLGVSPDSAESHAKFAEKYSLPFRLLSDPDKVLSQAYGAWGKKQNYGREYMGVIRSTFVIGADGVIAAAYRGVKVDGHVQKVFARATGGGA